LAQRRLPSIELKHPHCQTRWRRGIAPLAAVFSTAYTEVPAGRWTVLRVVNGWPSLDSFNIHDIARRDREEKPSSALELSESFRQSRLRTLLSSIRY
jgi:hypothetical protein